MSPINAWWQRHAGERFWLGIAGLDGKREVLAAPCSTADAPNAPGDAMIHHVKAGDALFHYDRAREAIVAWSSPHGKLAKTRMSWPDAAGAERREFVTYSPLPTWAIGLDRAMPLDDVVPLDEVARVQWSLFPALQEMEDLVGEPLHYPFEMGSPSRTRLPAGRVFKLPSLFVSRIPALARAARHMSWFDGAGADDLRREPDAVRRAAV